MKKKGILGCIIMLLFCALFVAGCGSTNQQKKVALLFSHEPSRWTEGGQMMKEKLENEGMQAEITVFTTEQDQTTRSTRPLQTRWTAS